MSELNNKINELRTLKKSYSDLADSQNVIIERLSHMALSSRSVDGVYSVSEGISITHLLGTQLDLLSVTSIKDKDTGWIIDKQGVASSLISLFPNVTSIEFGCVRANGEPRLFNNTTTGWNGDIIFTNLEVTGNYISCLSNGNQNVAPNVTVHVYGLKTVNNNTNGSTSFYTGRVYYHDLERGRLLMGGSGSYANQTTTYLYIGCKGGKDDALIIYHTNGNKLITDIEIGEGACQNLDISLFTGITEENMVNHILKKLKQDEEMCGSGVTITLGATNLAKLTSEEAVALLDSLTNTYGYTFA
jgi:hypothetical protein